MSMFDEDWTPVKYLDAKYFMQKTNFIKKIREEIHFAEVGGISDYDLDWLKEELNAQRRSSNSLDLYEEEGD